MIFSKRMKFFIMNYKSLSIIPVLFTFLSCSNEIKDARVIDRYPTLFPDYVNVVVPPNIAPLNFFIEDSAEKYRVEIYSDTQNKIIIEQSSPSIIINESDWHSMLNQSIGKILNIDVYVKKENWYRYKPILDSVVSEKIEPYLAYRLINNVNILWREIGIFQRNVENFEETPIFRNRSTGTGCVNCHHFNKSNPKQMSIHFRKSFPGTILFNGDSMIRLDTKTPYTMSSFSYPAWHPSGNYLAYVVNRVNQIFSSSVNYHEVVYDDASDLVIYDIKKNLVTTSPKVSSQNRENLPCFSPDGKWLYYISAPKKISDTSRMYVKYDLVRISYDATTNTWGDPDTLLRSRETGKSITFPRVSPDGRYIIFTMGQYSYFPIFDKTADLYIFDIETNQYRKLESNSDFTDSYHTWSQTGRWFVFSSRRIDDLFTRPFYSYFDKTGKAHKPFVLPQKDPLFYKKFMKNYNLPELINAKVDLNENELRDFVQTDAKSVKFDTSVNIDALSGATFLNRQAH
jgi:hypothetical protein